MVPGNISGKGGMERGKGREGKEADSGIIKQVTTILSCWEF